MLRVLCGDQDTAMSMHQSPDAIYPVPAEYLESGFRLLVLREIRNDNEPPAFAWIEQHLLRPAHRIGRHGLFFASAFLPEIMEWLSAHLGRPSLRDSEGQPYRNSLWPAAAWHSENRLWPDGGNTMEWFVDVSFPGEASWAAFQLRWNERLMGKMEKTAA